MKLQRLHLENFKRFRAPFAIEGLDSGLNLFTAPNEAGKSTLVEAIRSAFFERHRSSTVEHLRPWGDSTATPTVVLDFQVNGKNCRLTKAFLGKKRCELQMGDQALDGNAAEDHLAELLGFKLPGRGASTPEHMGIPGLLWIRQGSAHEVHEVVGHASDHLRNALGASLGDLAASSGDAVVRAVELERNALLTPATGAPRGALQAALQQRSQLDAALEVLQRDIAAYQVGVDRLATLRTAHRSEEADRPWEALQQQLAQARSRWQDAQGLADKKAAQDAALAQSTAQVHSWRSQLQALEREESALAQRTQALQSAEEKRATAEAELQAWEPRHRQAAQADAAARAALEQARRTAALQTELRAAAQLDVQLAALEQQCERAQAGQATVARCQAQVQALALPDKALKKLQATAQALHTAQTRQGAVATTLEFALQPGAGVHVVGGVAGGVALQGSGRHSVTGRTELEIDGVGRLTVWPGGGTDLEALAAECAQQRSALDAQLAALGVDSVAAAEERARQHQERAAQAKEALAVLAVLAPQGLAALETECTRVKAQRGAAQQALAALAAVPGSVNGTLFSSADHAEAKPDATDAADASQPLAVQPAERAEAAARSALAAASEGLQAARLAVANAQSQLQSASDELRALQHTLSDPERARTQATAQAALVDARAQQAVAQERVDALAMLLQGVNLPLLAQDVERLESSARQIEAAHRQRSADITRLEVELETRGALGLEESAAQKLREREHAARRCDELERHARALDHLLQLLRAKRSALAQRLRAPLQKHLSHYLHILFPGAQVEVGDDLAPGRITRTGPHGAEAGALQELSVGAREQMGVVARFAYADLLKEAGKPTLLILDDALVHTDAVRLAQMKRVLYDAATRHQILLFSCHPDAWRDLGVAARTLG